MILYKMPMRNYPLSWDDYTFLIKEQVDQAMVRLQESVNESQYVVNSEGHYIYRGNNFYLVVGAEHVDLDLFFPSGGFSIEFRTFRNISNSRIPPTILSQFMVQVQKVRLLWSLTH